MEKEVHCVVVVVVVGRMGAAKKEEKSGEQKVEDGTVDVGVRNEERRSNASIAVMGRGFGNGVARYLTIEIKLDWR